MCDMRWMLLLAVAVSGCATSRPMMGPDGTQHVSVSCPRSISNCYEEAGRSCPSGYDLVDKTDDSTVVTTNSGPVVARKFTMLVKCRGRQQVAATEAASAPAPATTTAKLPAWWCNERWTAPGSLRGFCYARRDLPPEEKSLASEAVTRELYRIGARAALKTGQARFTKTSYPMDIVNVGGVECAMWSESYALGPGGDLDAEATLRVVPAATPEPARYAPLQ